MSNSFKNDITNKGFLTSKKLSKWIKAIKTHCTAPSRSPKQNEDVHKGWQNDDFLCQKK